MQRSTFLFFWRAGNNEHEGIWEDIVSYTDLRPTSDSLGFNQTCQLPSGDNGPSGPAHPSCILPHTHRTALLALFIRGNVRFLSPISSYSGTCWFSPFAGVLLWGPERRGKGNVVGCCVPRRHWGALCWVLPASSCLRLPRAPSLGSLWGGVGRLAFGCSFNGCLWNFYWPW